MGSDPVRTPRLALAALAATTLLASAQTFQAYYGPDTSFGNDIINSRDCGFVAVGVTSGATGPTGTFVMRLNPEGKVNWSKQYSDQGLLSRGYSVVESSRNDDLIVGGMAGSQRLGVQCQFVMRTDSAGTPIWNAMLNGGSSLQALFPVNLIGFLPTGATELHKGQIASIGHLSNVNGAARVGMLSLLDADGSLLFSNRYVPPGGSTIALDFIQARETRDPDPSSEILVLGTMTIATNVFAMFAMRTDIDGNIIWARTYRHNDGVTSLAGQGFDLASNGDILFSAARALLPVTPGTNPNTVVGRIDALTGDPVWAVYVDDFGPGYQAVTRTPDDGFLVAGVVGPLPNTTTAALRIDGGAHNPQLWRYGSVVPNARAIGEAIVPVVPWGGYAIFGRTSEFSPTDTAFLVRTNNDMLSRCNEEELHVSAGTVELDFHSAAPQIVADTLYVPDLLTSVDLDLRRNEQCLFTRCLGDLTADGFVDDSDFVLFATAYNTLICPTDPAITCCPADLNNDTFVDDADFVLFADAYNALLCP